MGVRGFGIPDGRPRQHGGHYPKRAGGAPFTHARIPARSARAPLPNGRPTHHSQLPLTTRNAPAIPEPVNKHETFERKVYKRMRTISVRSSARLIQTASGREGKRVFGGLERRPGKWVVIADPRSRQRSDDPQVLIARVQILGRLHAAAITVRGQLSGDDAVALARCANEPLRQCGRFAPRQHPRDDVATKQIERTMHT